MYLVSLIPRTTIAPQPPDQLKEINFLEFNQAREESNFRVSPRSLYYWGSDHLKWNHKEKLKQIILQDNRLIKKSQCHGEKKAEKHSVMYYSQLTPVNIPLKTFYHMYRSTNEGKNFFFFFVNVNKTIQLTLKTLFFFLKKAWNLSETQEPVERPLQTAKADLQRRDHQHQPHASLLACIWD